MNQKGFGLKEFVIVFAVGLYMHNNYLPQYTRSIVPSADVTADLNLNKLKKLLIKDLEEELETSRRKISK